MVVFVEIRAADRVPVLPVPFVHISSVIQTLKGLSHEMDLAFDDMHWLEDCANFTPRKRKTTNTAPSILQSTVSAIQATSQSTFINAQL
jgi:hypothetical protein